MKGKRRIIRQRIRNGAKQTPKELASCYGKIRHSTYEAAKQANLEKIDKVRPYKCQFCPFYHVGRRTAPR